MLTLSPHFGFCLASNILVILSVYLDFERDSKIYFIIFFHIAWLSLCVLDIGIILWCFIEFRLSRAVVFLPVNSLFCWEFSSSQFDCGQRRIEACFNFPIPAHKYINNTIMLCVPTDVCYNVGWKRMLAIVVVVHIVTFSE